MSKRVRLPLALLTLLIAFIELSGLPASLFMDLQILDVEPFYWTQLVNFLLIGLVSFLTLFFLCPGFSPGLGRAGFQEGLRKYGYEGFLISVIGFIGYYMGLFPLNAHPGFLKVFIEGFVYCIGVAAVEEFYIRGLLLNLVESLFPSRRDRAFLAIVLTSLLFGLGHIPGSLGLPFYSVACQVVITTCMGFFLGMVYRKSGNLWLPILFHFCINFGALPYCFSTFRGYSPLTLIIIVPAYVILGIYSLAQLEKA